MRDCEDRYPGRAKCCSIFPLGICKASPEIGSWWYDTMCLGKSYTYLDNSDRAFFVRLLLLVSVCHNYRTPRGRSCGHKLVLNVQRVFFFFIINKSAKILFQNAMRCCKKNYDFIYKIVLTDDIRECFQVSKDPVTVSILTQSSSLTSNVKQKQN